jgi:hypothetical protein
MREKLIELLAAAQNEIDIICRERFQCDGCPADIYGGSCKVEYIANYLLENGVTVPVGEVEFDYNAEDC